MEPLTMSSPTPIYLPYPPQSTPAEQIRQQIRLLVHLRKQLPRNATAQVLSFAIVSAMETLQSRDKEAMRALMPFLHSCATWASTKIQPST